MRARRTHESNAVFRLSGGTEDNDLWVTRCRTQDGDKILASTWVPTEEEREAIANGANIELIVWGESTPPVLMQTTTVEIGKAPEPEAAT